MAGLCLSPVPFPICVKAASILTTTVYVKSHLSDHKLCYYPEAVPNCTMPGNLTLENGFYPVVANGTEGYSIHAEAALDKTYTDANFTVGTHIKTLIVKESVATNIVVDSENATVRGLNNQVYPAVETIVVLQPNVAIVNMFVKTIVIPEGINPMALNLQNVTIQNPLQIAPANDGFDVDVTNAYFANVTGNYIALLHHVGAVQADNSEIIWLPRQANSLNVQVISSGKGSNLNVARLTGIFGKQYQIEQAAGGIVFENIQAQRAFNLLLIPTIIVFAATVFSNLDGIVSEVNQKEGKSSQ